MKRLMFAIRPGVWVAAVAMLVTGGIVAAPATTAMAVVTFHLLDANRDYVSAANSGGQFFSNPQVAKAVIYLNPLETVRSGWPFSDWQFNNLYHGDDVVQLQQMNGGGGCMQTDSVHSSVVDAPCGSHNAGTYWVGHRASSRGACVNGADWLVNVGITNHYDPYPYGFAMFVNSNRFIYVQSHRAISVDDQWCFEGPL